MCQLPLKPSFTFLFHFPLILIDGRSSSYLSGGFKCWPLLANCVFLKEYLAIIVIKYALKLNHNGFLLCELFSRTGRQSCKSDELLPLIFVKQFDQKCNIGSGRRRTVFSYTSSPKGLFSCWSFDSLKRWVDDKELWISYIYLLLPLKKLIEDWGLWGVKGGYTGQDFLS